MSSYPTFSSDFGNEICSTVPVVTGLPSNAFLKESSISGSPIDVPFGENEIAESSPSTVKCLHCPKFYSGFDMLKEHIQLCHPERAIGYSCVQCNAAFSNREQLEKHQVLHSPESQVSCSVCNKNFANVYRLQRHMISHDESAVLRKFKCPQCEKAFKFKHHLKEHIRIHSGEKPFACEHCGKRFSHSGSYSSHNTSKKCLIMNLKVNHRNRNAANAAVGAVGADPKSVANGQQPSTNQAGSRVSSGKSKMPSNNNNNNNISVSNNNHNKNLTNNNHHLNNHNNNNNIINNNDHPFTSILPKYPDGAGILLPGYPFYFAPGISPYFPPNINQLLEQFGPLTPAAIAAYRENSKEIEEVSRGVASGEDVTEIVIKKEIKMEEEECEKLSSASSSTSTMLPAATAAAPAARPCSAEDRRTGNDLEAVKRILESVSESVTKQQSQQLQLQPFPLGLPKLQSTSCSSGCPSVSSEMPSSPAIADDTSQSHDSAAAAMAAAAACRYCGRVCHSLDELQQHEKFICSARDDTKKNEGLAAKLEDIISSRREENGLSAFNSESEEEAQGSGKEFFMTEDEDIDGVSDSRRVRVRSQIAEEQLVVLKQHYALNPRPKREELEIISQRVGFPVRVVQVWFQNNRARDRREGRFVPIPYAPAAPYPPSGGGSASATDPYSGAELSPRLLPPTSSSVSMDQPLDLSTKRSTSSSPASSPYPYDSDECGAVNLSSRKSPLSAHLLQQHHHQMALATLAAASTTSCCPPTTPPASSVQQLTAAMLDGGASYRTSPTPPPLTPEKRLMPYNHQRTPGTPNSANSIFFSMERIVYTCNASHSPVTSSSPIYNGSCSPNSSDSWKPEFLHSNDLELKDDSRMGEDMSLADCRTVVTSTKKSKINSNNSADSETKGEERPHKCDICPKAFKHKHHLTEHKRLHSGEKPFQCKKCLKRFSHSGSYSQHKNHRFSYCKPYRD